MYRRNRKHINKLPPETEKQREDKEETIPGTQPPIQPSPISVIPIQNQSNNQTRSGRVIRMPNRYQASSTT